MEELGNAMRCEMVDLKNEDDKKCGEVFLTLKGETIFHCTLCGSKYCEIQNYGMHIIDKHAIDFVDTFKILESQMDDMMPDIPDLVIEKNTSSGELNELSFDENRVNLFRQIHFKPSSPIDDIVLMNEDDYDKQCGEVHLTKKGSLIFNCTLCDRKYKGIQEYNQHAVGEHYTSSEYVKEVTFEILWPNNIEKENKLLKTNETDVIVENLVADKGKEDKSTKRSIPMWKEKFDSIQCPKTNRTLYKCKLCSTVIKDKSNIPHHIRRVHEKIRRYKCNECHRQFHSRTEHKIHMRHHTGEKPYLCFNCGMKFISASELQRHHTKKHTKQVRDKACPICSKTFTTRKNLYKHKTVHTDERPFKCEICDAKFKVKSSLTLHNRIHEDKRAFKCNICSASYNYKSILKSHMQSKHAIALE